MLALAENEEMIGSHLSEVIVAQRMADVTFDTPCPKCGLKLAVVRSRGTGKRFIGCNGKWQTGCSFTLPLPQFGHLTLLSRQCNTCGFQMIQARSRGRRPLVSCPRCYVAKARDAGSSSKVSGGSLTNRERSSVGYLKLLLLSRTSRKVKDAKNIRIASDTM